MKLFLKVAVLTAVAVFLMKMVSPYLGMNNRLVDQAAPDFTLELIDGKKASMTELRDGSPAIIFFWATWCPHCRTQLKEMTEQGNQFKEEGIKILLVNLGEERQKVAQYLKANHILFDNFLDTNETLPEVYHLFGVPTFFFVDQEGIVVDVKNVLPPDYQKILLGRISP